MTHRARWTSCFLLLFAVASCDSPFEPLIGKVQVSVTTTGGDPDLDGYEVAVGSEFREPVPANGTVLVSRVPAGSHEVQLNGVAGNCTVSEGNPRVVTVTGGETAQLTLAVMCVATGVHVTTATTGVDFDLDGYAVAVDGGTAVPIGENNTIDITRLGAGPHTVALSGLAANCAVVGDNPRSVSVAAGQIVPVSFAVTCAQAPQLAVTLTVNNNTDVYLVKANGTGLTRLTTHAAEDGGPAWSSDGSKIAFHSVRDGNFEIYVMNADGSGVSRLTNTPAPEGHPRWSPDGTKIAFVSQRDGNSEIYVMNADGTNQVRLTNHPGIDDGPAWSPDGTRIAFQSSRDGLADKIYVMNADGSGLIRLTTNGGFDVQPDWSPNGAQIVFSRLASCYNGFCDYDLFVMSAADGSGATQLTSQFSDNDAAWSPDGQWIAYQATECDYYCYWYGFTYEAVRIVRTDGSRDVEVLRDASNPVWRP